MKVCAWRIFGRELGRIFRQSRDLGRHFVLRDIHKYCQTHFVWVRACG